MFIVEILYTDFIHESHGNYILVQVPCYLVSHLKSYIID